MTTYTSPTSSGWGWAPKAYSFGAALNTSEISDPIFSKSVLRTFRQAVFFDYPNSQTTLRTFAQAVITDSAPRVTTLRTLRQVVITDTQSNIVGNRGGTKATVYANFPDATNGRSFERAIMYAKSSDNVVGKSMTKALLYSTVFDIGWVIESAKAHIFAPNYDGLFIHSVVQSTIFDIIESSLFLTSVTKAAISAQSGNSIKMTAASRAVLIQKLVTDNVYAAYAGRATIHAAYTDAQSLKQSCLSQVFGAIPNRLYTHATVQSVIFDVPSDFAETKSTTKGYLYGIKPTTTKLSAHGRAYLQLRLANGPPSDNPAYPYDPNDPTDPENPLNPNNPNHTNDPGSLIPIVSNLRSNTAAEGRIFGGVTNSVFTHSVIQSAIFEVSQSDTALLNATRSTVTGQVKNTTKLSSVSRAVLWFSDRAYGRRRVTYFA